MLNLCYCLWHDESAVTSVEYALLLALVATAALVSWEGLGCRVLAATRYTARRFPHPH